MKVTGFSIIRNALIYDFPIVEAIKSILPLCDDFVVAVGKSNDTTLDLIQNIHPEKIRIIETVWDDSLRKGGQVLAQETNKAFQAIGNESDWAFYIQGDECLHEKYHASLLEAMHRWQNDDKVEGLLLKYLHFYGSYDYVGSSAKWYPNEVRIIKNRKDIYSYRDAQGFRCGDNQKLRVKPTDAYIYHYGWVRPPKVMQSKIENTSKYWHPDDWIKNNIARAEAFDYSAINSLNRFEFTHPEVILPRIAAKYWTFDYDISKNQKSIKETGKSILRKFLGTDFGYKNYRF